MPLRIGTSGWQYRHWSGCFYPADLPVSRWLRFYAGCFETVEVDSAFYRLPAADVFARWRDETLASFPEGIRLAVEARHESWDCDAVWELLARHKAAWCIADAPWRRWPVVKTSDWGYFRFHEGVASPRPCYGSRALASWASRIARTWPAEADVYAYFNNDACTCAPRDAQRFAAACTREGLLTSRVSPP